MRAGEDVFLSTVGAQRWVLFGLVSEMVLALYLYTFRASWQSALEPLRDRHGGFIQYIPSAAALVAWVADFGAYVLWLISFGEMILWIASAADLVAKARGIALAAAAAAAVGANKTLLKTSRTSVTADGLALFVALCHRPLRLADAFAVLLYAGVLAMRGDSGELCEGQMRRAKTERKVKPF